MLGVQCSGPLAPHYGGEALARVSEAGTDRPELTGGRGRETPPVGDPRATERDAWVVLLGVPGLGPVSFTRLLTAFGSARAVLEATAGPNGVARIQEALAESAGGDGDGPGLWDDSSRATVDGAGTQGSVHPATRVISSPRTAGADLAARIRRQVDEAERVLSVVRSLGLTVVTLDDAEYPGAAAPGGDAAASAVRTRLHGPPERVLRGRRCRYPKAHRQRPA